MHYAQGIMGCGSGKHLRAFSLSPQIFVESESAEIQTSDALPQMLLTHRVCDSLKFHVVVLLLGQTQFTMCIPRPFLTFKLAYEHYSSRSINYAIFFLPLRFHFGWRYFYPQLIEYCQELSFWITEQQYQSSISAITLNCWP